VRREQGRPDYAYDVPAKKGATIPVRPFLVMAFLPRGQTLEHFLSKLGANVQPERTIGLTGGTVSVKLADQVLFTPATDALQNANATPEPPRKRDLFWENTHQLLRPAGFQPVEIVRVKQTLLSSAKFYPLELQLTPGAKLINAGTFQPTDWSRFYKALSPELECWAVNRKTLARQRGDAPAPAKGAEPEPLLTKVKLALDKPSLVEPPGPAADETSARLRIPVRRPVTVSGHPAARHFVWIATLRPDPTACEMLVPEEMSTEDDSDPNNITRILNLRRLVRAVLDENYIPARQDFFTEWH
jgi:hypothetical protein